MRLLYKDRRRLRLLLWLCAFLTAGFMLGRVSAQSPVDRCIDILVEDINPRLMAPQTARRKARVICYDIRYRDPSFYKALTQ